MKLSRPKIKQTKNPIKYDIIPTISGVYLSDLLDMSLSVPSFFAQNKIIAIGNIDANINEINSKTMNLLKLNCPPLNDSIRQIIKNNGMQIIGGFAIVDMVFAIFNLFI